MAFIYFDTVHAVEVHDEIIIKSGGVLGLLNRGLLDSTLEHVQNDLYYPNLEDKVTHFFIPLTKIIVFKMVISEHQSCYLHIFWKLTVWIPEYLCLWNEWKI
jgi:prophage maintenance system killer protein